METQRVELLYTSNGGEVVEVDAYVLGEWSVHRVEPDGWWPMYHVTYLPAQRMIFAARELEIALAAAEILQQVEFDLVPADVLAGVQTYTDRKRKATKKAIAKLLRDNGLLWLDDVVVPLLFPSIKDVAP